MFKGARALLFAAIVSFLGSSQALADPFDFVRLRIRWMDDRTASATLGTEFLSLAKQETYKRMTRLYPEVADLTPEEFASAFSFHIDLWFLSGTFKPAKNHEFFPAFITGGELYLYVQQRQLSRSESNAQLSNINPELVQLKPSRGLNFSIGFSEPSDGSDTSFLESLLTPESLMTYLKQHPRARRYIPFLGASPIEFENPDALRWAIEQTPANAARRMQGLRSMVLALVKNMDFNWHIPAESIQSTVGRIVGSRRLPGSVVSSRLKPYQNASPEDLQLIQETIEAQIEALKARAPSYWNEIGVGAQLDIMHISTEDVTETERPIWGLGLFKRVARTYRIVTIQLDAQANIAEQPIVGPPSTQVKFMIMDGTATTAGNESLMALNSFFEQLQGQLGDRALSKIIERRDHQTTLRSAQKSCELLMAEGSILK